MMNQDPRSTKGIMARGANIYSAASSNSHAGKMHSSMKNFPEYKKLSLMDVARKALNGQSQSSIRA